VSSARRDLVAGTAPTNIALNVTDLEAWDTSDRLQVTSSQALTNYRAFFSPAPMAGVTSFNGTAPWFGDGLGDASKGDVVFVHQRVKSTPVSGTSTASLMTTAKFARLTDVTIIDGGTANASAQMTAAPQSGAMAIALRSSQFAALAPDVHPTLATVEDGQVIVLSVPHSANYPDMPSTLVTSLATLDVLTDPSDVDYGTIRYGQFLDPFWKEFRRVFFLFNVANSFATATFQSDVPMSAVGAGAITPVVSPPKSPLVNGMDAFSFPSGVGSQPTISWSPPVIGTASSYVVEIFAMTLDLQRYQRRSRWRDDARPQRHFVQGPHRHLASRHSVLGENHGEAGALGHRGCGAVQDWDSAPHGTVRGRIHTVTFRSRVSRLERPRLVQ